MHVRSVQLFIGTRYLAVFSCKKESINLCSFQIQTMFECRCASALQNRAVQIGKCTEVSIGHAKKIPINETVSDSRSTVIDSATVLDSAFFIEFF